MVLPPVLQRFAAVIMRIREPKTTALIFASGKMVCTGAKSEQDSKLAAKKVGGQAPKFGLYCRPAPTGLYMAVVYAHAHGSIGPVGPSTQVDALMQTRSDHCAD
jgi:hypothetical protein